MPKVTELIVGGVQIYPRAAGLQSEPFAIRHTSFPNERNTRENHIGSFTAFHLLDGQKFQFDNVLLAKQWRTQALQLTVGEV